MKTQTSTRPIRVALIDLYNGEPNQGIRAITELVENYSFRGRDQEPPIQLQLDRFETRLRGDIPDLSYDVYISSGGPGSPFDGEGEAWERTYFNWVDAVWEYNEKRQHAAPDDPARHVLFICHSFQMMCRHFQIGDVVQRESESFGIVQTYQTANGLHDPLFTNLSDPFYAADFRHWQVIHPHNDRINRLRASIIALEKPRENPTLERALMGVRLTNEMAGVQFHPEADPPGMLVHFQDAGRREKIRDTYGEEEYDRLIERLRHPDFVAQTYHTVIPNFLTKAIAPLLPSTEP